MGSDSKKLAFADFEVDLDHRRLFQGGEQISLNAKTFELLVALLDRRGEIVGKDELLNTVWDGQFVEEGNLAVHISRLRKILGESKIQNEFIATIPGRGYCFVARVSEGTDRDTVIHKRSVTNIVVEEEIIDSDEADAFAVERVSKRTDGLHTISTRYVLTAAAILGLLIVAGGVLLWATREEKQNFGFSRIQIKRLTTSGNIVNAAISPDGKLFVYSSSNGDGESLWTAHTAGGDKLELRPSSDVVYQNLAFSSDGNSIFYTVGPSFSAASLYRLPVFGGGPPVKVRDGIRRFSISKDSSRIAFVNTDANGRSSLVSINSDGSDEKMIAQLPDSIAKGWISPAWSPDESKIAVAADLGPNDMGLFVVDLSTNSVVRLGSFSWHTVRGLTWLQDGKTIVAVGVAPDALLAQVWQTSFPDGETSRVTSDLVDYVFATSASNSGELMLVAGVSESNIWVAPAADLRQAKQVTFSSPGARIGWVGVTWTAAGKVLYTNDSADGTTIWEMEPDGTQQRQLVASGGANRFPTTDRNGHHVVFESNRGGHYAVWRTDASGEGMTRLTNGPIAGQPFISPDGKWIIYSTTEDGMGELFRISVDGGDPKRLTDLRVGSAQISPDSLSIACAADVNGSTKLALLSIDGGDPLKIFELPDLANVRGGIRWTPDGKSLVYRDWKNGLWRQPVSGGEPSLIPGLPQEKLGNFDWSFDGKYFAFVRLISRNDAVVVATTK